MKNLPAEKAAGGEIPSSVQKSTYFCFSKFENFADKAFENKKFQDTLNNSL